MKVSVEGADPHQASLIVVLLHGGGASALDFLALSQQFVVDDSTCFLAPQALGASWFEAIPGQSRSAAEPHFSISVTSVLGLLDQHRSQPIVLIGFAEGAGVVAELLTHEHLPESVKGAWLASGGLVGQPQEWPEARSSSLPIVISGLQRDSARLEATARHFEQAGASVQREFVEGEELHIGASELTLGQKLVAGATR